MAYAEDVERLIPADQVRQLFNEAFNYFTEINYRDKKADDEGARRLAEAHAKGWEKVAKSIDEGFREVARAIRDSSR